MKNSIEQGFPVVALVSLLAVWVALGLWALLSPGTSRILLLGLAAAGTGIAGVVVVSLRHGNTPGTIGHVLTGVEHLGSAPAGAGAAPGGRSAGSGPASR